MRKSLALAATLIACMYTFSAMAQDAVIPPSIEAVDLKISRQGDLELNCGQLSQEAVLMREIITTTQDIKDDSKIKSRGIGVASAVGSLLIGTATAGIGFAAAGYMLDYSTNETADSADSVQDIAQQRRSLMMGIYNAKGCEGPMDHAMQDNLPQERAIQIAAVEPAAGDNSKDTPPVRQKPAYNE